MAQFDEEPLDDLEAELREEDPRFARGLARGRPCRPREYRRLLVWLLLAAAYAALVVGLAVEHAPLIALGVVLAAAGARVHEQRRAGVRDPHR